MFGFISLPHKGAGHAPSSNCLFHHRRQLGDGQLLVLVNTSLASCSAACVGENVVTMKTAQLTMFHELEPAYVVGDFTLNPNERGFVISPQKPLKLCADRPAKAREGWNSQGHPFLQRWRFVQRTLCSQPPNPLRCRIGTGAWRK
jgi:hypothetical protein